MAEYTDVKTTAQKRWASAFRQLAETANMDNYNPMLVATTSNSRLEAEKWLVWLSDNYSDALPIPDVTADGEGGVDIELQIGDLFILIQIKSDSDLSSVYVEEGSTFNSYPLNEKNLHSILESHITIYA
jgi:hypothetical protein